MHDDQNREKIGIKEALGALMGVVMCILFLLLIVHLRASPSINLSLAGALAIGAAFIVLLIILFGRSGISFKGSNDR